MKYYSKKQWTQKLTIMVFLAMALGGTAVQAMPSGADIRSGQGSISQDGKNMTVQQNSQRMAIDWTKFDIAKDETVRYAQPDRNAISLNRGAAVGHCRESQCQWQRRPGQPERRRLYQEFQR